ncbi:helix-turn-helix domain-containing protein [Pontiellaceae bacterium B12219]|nr:helix-turn-helix domain-containing protein [Pontiellaceae bacterium B12219]
MKYQNIGKELLDYSIQEGSSIKGLLEELFPYIYAASDRMSTRKISEWLEENYDVKISYSSIAKALQKSDEYIEKAASEYYGESVALQSYIPREMNCTGVQVFASSSLCGSLMAEGWLVNDSYGLGDSILKWMEKTWFVLPEKYREACILEMSKIQKQGRKNNETTEGE